MKRTIFYFLFFITTINASEIIYSGKELFPVHEEMKPAVQFWIDIYSKYGTNQYIIHDSRHLGIVYEVVKLGNINNPDEQLTKSQKRILKNKSKHYKEQLRAIAAAWPDTNKLDDEQKKIKQRLSVFTKKADFLNASRRIRAQKGQRNKFKAGLEISGRYMPYLKKIFAAYNLPQELTVLPHVESSFNYKAYSSAGAAGIWQFTRGTGKQYMKISYEIDERLDPLIATESAARLLSHNYRSLGNWPMAITAYNHGLNGMKRAKRKYGSDMNKIIKHYRSRYFKFASRNFYTEFLAALHVVQHYRDYFGEITFAQPIQYKEFELPRYLKYSSLIKYLDMDRELFQAYNPALRQSVYNNSKYIPKGYRLRLPVDISADSLLAAIPETEYLAEQKTSKYYRIRYGDTLSDIARRFGTSVELLLAINNISNAHYIRRGMTIRLPDKSHLMPVLTIVEETIQQSSDVNPLMLASLDQTFLPKPVWLQEMTFIDSLSNQEIVSISEGETKYLRSPDSLDLDIEFIRKGDQAIGYIRVEPEETLGHYADWLGIKTQRIRNWNNLSFSTPIKLNQKIKLTFATLSANEFIRKRLEYHRGIEEDFFMNYEITGTSEHTIKNGDNIWYLCNYEYNLPYWLIVDYNKDMDFSALKKGDKLVIPTIKARN